ICDWDLLEFLKFLSELCECFAFDLGASDCSGAGVGFCCSSTIGAGSRFTQTNTSPSTNSMPGLLIIGAYYSAVCCAVPNVIVIVTSLAHRGSSCHCRK